MKNNAVIVYFSKDGSTKILAEELAKQKQADVIELVPTKEMNFFTKSIRALLKKGTELKGNPYNESKSYDELYLCTPIWALNGTPAMISFINNTDFTGKYISILTVKGFPESVSGTHKYLSNKIKSRNGNVIATYDIKGAPIGKKTTLSNIQDQIKKLKI